MEQKFNKDSVTIKKEAVKNFLNTKVKDFAKYVIATRAMPSIMDGMRPGARKILWSAMKGELNKVSKVKMPTLIGNTMGYHYNHGDASLMNTIIQLSSTHVFKYAPFEVDGQIDTLRGKSDTAARYLHIRKTQYLDWFKTDLELASVIEQDGDKVEPAFFLPIIPIQLLYRTNSPGFGFSYRCFSYNIDEIIDNCIKAIKYGTCLTATDEIMLIPTIEGIKPENMIYNSNKDSWYNVGEYIVNLEKDALIITDLPYNISFDSFESHLHSLQEKQYISSFTDLSMDGKMKYIVSFQRGRLSLLIKDQWKFYQTMKLFSKIPKDTLNCIDEDGKSILNFESPLHLIDIFVKKRLVYYLKRKTRTIALLEEDIKEINFKIKFIDLIVNDKLIINKRKIADIKVELDSFELPYDVLKLNIDKVTIEEINKLADEKAKIEIYLDYIRKTSIQEQYVIDLINLKEKYCTINNGLKPI